jgi:hypothetical protein
MVPQEGRRQGSGFMAGQRDSKKAMRDKGTHKLLLALVLFLF